MEIMMITSSLDCLLRIHPSVSQAMAENKPVVALESTIITHGMPYPHNLRYQKWPSITNKLGYQKLIFVLRLNDELECYTGQPRRWRLLYELKEPLPPRLASSVGKSMLDCRPRSLTTSPRARSPRKCHGVICPTSLAKWVFDTLITL